MSRETPGHGRIIRLLAEQPRPPRDDTGGPEATWRPVLSGRLHSWVCKLTLIEPNVTTGGDGLTVLSLSCVVVSEQAP